MGLFDLFTGRGKEDDDKLDLSEFAGMRVEVMDEGGALLFSARASESWDNALVLQPITVPQLRRATDEIPVTLRGYEDETRQAVHMDATLVRRSDGTWRAEDIEITGRDNDRAFYRQSTSIGGEITPMQGAGLYTQPCRVLNISAGGVCILVEPQYRIGDRLLLKSNLLEGWSMTPLLCEVRRVTKRKNGYEYGCEFTELTPAMEDMIAKAIMEMQVRQKRYE